MKKKGKGFPLKYYPGEILTEIQARINRKMFLFRGTGMGGVLSPNVSVIFLPPTPITINRVQSTTLDGINSPTKHISYIAPVISNRPNKILLTNEQLDEFSQISSEFRDDLISMEEAVLLLRGGDGSTDVVGILAFVIFINWYDSLFSVKAFQANLLPHQDPFGWLSGKYDSRNVGPSPIPTISTRMRSTALHSFGPSQTQASTFNNLDGSVNLDMDYQEVLRRARFSENFNCSFDRFVELASEAGESTNDSLRAS